MADEAQTSRQINWAESFSFPYLFRAFRLAIHPTKLILAFCGIFLTYGTGRALDAMWPSESLPATVVAADGSVVETELSVFLRGDGGGGHVGTRAWLESLKPDSIQRHGTFDLLLDHARVTINTATSAVIHADFDGLVSALKRGFLGDLWLFTLHPVYAALFCIAGLVIWSLFGGALCRVAAMHATREERIGLRDAMAFAGGKFFSFLAAPLMPVGVILIFGVLLFLGGLMGLIPAVGEVLVGILFFLALIAGFIIAFVVIGAVAGVSLTFPTIAVEGSDAFDALSRTFSYVYQRPWRTAFYAILSLAYGAVCLAFVKILARIMLWAVHLFVGFSMNWGDAFGRSAGGEGVRIPDKLNALWQGPSLTGETTFWGSFPDLDLAHLSLFGRFWFYLWIFLVLGMVGAFVVSFFSSSCTLIYLLLRREVDATDLEDVYLEEEPEAELPSPTPETSEPKQESEGASPSAAEQEQKTESAPPPTSGQEA